MLSPKILERGVEHTFTRIAARVVLAFSTNLETFRMSTSSPEPEPRDENGYPTSARLKLKRVREGEDLFEDMHSGHKFKPIKRKGGIMLLPVFEKNVKWKTEQGFKAMLLLLSCMGAQNEFQLWNTHTNAQMTLDDWKKKKVGSKSCLPTRHNTCGEVVETTSVSDITSGRRIGCSCFSQHAEANKWANRRAEILEIGIKRNFKVLTPQEKWVTECTGTEWCPELLCLECNENVTTTRLLNLKRGHDIGCRCNNTHAEAKLFKNRRAEIAEIGVERGFRVLTPQEKWVTECTGNEWCPELLCLECNEQVSSTRLANLQRGGSIGCRCNNNNAESNMWKNRRPEIAEIGVERNFKVVTTEEDWVTNCTGTLWCPELLCLECNENVTTTCLNSLQQGNGIGCRCKNKTEKKLSDWFAKYFPGVVVTFQYKLPDNATKFDFHLCFPDGFQVFVELDGAQHFWRGAYHFSEEGCKRDFNKETWAVGTKRTSVIRLLQDDVWEDKYGWDTYLRTRFEKARVAPNPEVFVPDNAPEYTSSNSFYVQLRK